MLLFVEKVPFVRASCSHVEVISLCYFELDIFRLSGNVSDIGVASYNIIVRRLLHSYLHPPLFFLKNMYWSVQNGD